jgi:hypothetical protein
VEADALIGAGFALPTLRSRAFASSPAPKKSPYDEGCRMVTEETDQWMNTFKNS